MNRDSQGEEHPLDAILIHHPTSDENRPILFPAMGLFSLADTLEHAGIRTRIIHVGIETSLDPAFNIVNVVDHSGVRLAGISLHWFFQLPDSLALAASLKKARPDIMIVLGGFTASIFAREIIEQNPHVDAVVRGDGERPLEELARRILEDPRSDLENVPNLVYRSRGGDIVETAFDHVSTADELKERSFSNLVLLEHYEEFLERTAFPTIRFKNRISPPGRGLFALETGRGCPYSCTFCGGSRQAQIRIANRHKPVFRNIQCVLDTIHEVMEHGCRSFYVCFDPDPNGEYYRELFSRIREAKLELYMVFGSWRLPDRSFIEAFRSTFVDGLFEISPESGIEKLRKASKGPLSYGNAELEQCLGHIGTHGLLAQVFFGYFLPGDTRDTIMKTQRYARALENEHCEALYLALSTDPASVLQSAPDEHGVHLDVRDLDDYLEALSKRRASPNLLAHRPASMTRAESENIVRALNIDSILHRMLPSGIRALGLITGNPNTAERIVADICRKSCQESNQKSLPRARDLMRLVAEAVSVIELEASWTSLLEDIASYEIMPYVLMEERLGKSSTHYSVYTRWTKMNDAEREAFLSRSDVAVEDMTLEHDIEEVMCRLNDGVIADPRPLPVSVSIAVDACGLLVTRVTRR
jgi:radical SAM superfamily enzyme YgiQ (UPF0313 family)